MALIRRRLLISFFPHFAALWLLHTNQPLLGNIKICIVNTALAICLVYYKQYNSPKANITVQQDNLKSINVPSIYQILIEHDLKKYEP